MGDFIYRYNELGQLLYANHAGKHQHFTFDANENLLNESHDLKKSLDKKSEIRKIDRDIRGNTSHIQLARSNRNVKELLCLYDTERQLTECLSKRNQFSLKSTYAYDGFGRRISKNVQRIERDALTEKALDLAGGMKIFSWIGDQLAIEFDSTTSTVYIFEPDSFIPLCTVCYRNNVPARVITYFICNLAGAPTEFIKNDTDIVSSMEMTAWGEVLDDSKSGNSESHISLRFAGQYWDFETGLHYNRHRYYAAELGSYLTQDPIGLHGGLNPYAYVTNPVQWIDPLGLARCRHISAAQEISSLPQLCDKRPCDIRKILRNRKYTMTGSKFNPSGSNTGGQVWTKPMADGHTAAVRIDPAEKRDTSKVFADGVPHAHKEIVPTQNVSEGNYAPPRQSGAILCDDNGNIAKDDDYFGKHIRIQKGRLKDRNNEKNK